MRSKNLKVNDIQRHLNGLRNREEIPIIKFATIPNFLTLSRLFLLPLILFFLATQQIYSALILMFISWVSDALDGYLARRLNQVTPVGKILDHLVDKIWVSSVFVVLVMTKRLPLSIALAVIIRDLLIVLGGSILVRRGVIPYSNIFGKITGFLFALLILTYALGIKPLTQPVFFLTWFFLVVSFLSYIPFFLKGSKSKGFSGDISH
jgi:cardiolipin synthase|uniref:CDP-alcohol phosphatidyltransferase family protein n=1 Tax=candidate division WOR-3 bacterium TaxID=2052148 RepID=A0A7C3UZM5_UNCW3